MEEKKISLILEDIWNEVEEETKRKEDEEIDSMSLKSTSIKGNAVTQSTLSVEPSSVKDGTARKQITDMILNTKDGELTVDSVVEGKNVSMSMTIKNSKINFLQLKSSLKSINLEEEEKQKLADLFKIDINSADEPSKNKAKMDDVMNIFKIILKVD